MTVSFERAQQLSQELYDTDINGMCQRLFGKDFDGTDPIFPQSLTNGIWETMLSRRGLYIPATNVFGIGASTPDHASFTQGATQLLDTRVFAAPEIWGAALISNQFGGQWPAAPNAGWVVSIHQNANMRLALTADGTTIIGPESTSPINLPARTPKWMQQTCLPNNGSSQRVFTYGLGDDGVNFTPLGTTVTEAGAFTPFNSTGPLGLPGQLWWGGHIMRFEVRINGVLVAAPNFAAQPPGTKQFTDSTGKVWTIGPGAVIT